MHKACQSIYSAAGDIVFKGEWDPKALVRVLSHSNEAFWRNKRILDIGANTCGLSIELARLGGFVTALEPDPYSNTYALSKDVVDDIIKREQLKLVIFSKSLFDAHAYHGYDVVLCLGLLYHFRYPQLVLDYLSTLEMDFLFISTQVHPGSSLLLMNRADPAVLKPGLLPSTTKLTGWHPTRPLLERMLAWAGFTDITSLTDSSYCFPNKPLGLSNSAYYFCRRATTTSPEVAMKDFYPR